MSEIEKLKTKLVQNHERAPADLTISRVPKKTIIAFKELAAEEFCKDYGFTLKWLMDGTISQDTQMLMDKILELEQRIIDLEIKPEKEEKKKVVKLLNGNELTGGKGK